MNSSSSSVAEVYAVVLARVLSLIRRFCISGSSTIAASHAFHCCPYDSQFAALSNIAAEPKGANRQFKSSLDFNAIIKIKNQEVHGP